MSQAIATDERSLTITNHNVVIDPDDDIIDIGSDEDPDEAVFVDPETGEMKEPSET